MNVRVKICGLTSEADARAAVDAGADCLGFVLYPKSPRFAGANRVREVIRSLPRGHLKVGVFVNERAEDVAEALRFCGLDIAQLHGHEPAATAQQVGLHRVWKAVALRTPQHVRTAADYPAAALVVDSMAPGKWGGTGEVGNWGLAAELAQRRPVVLAGGLSPENVAAAIAQVRPFAVDVSSGVEREPGKKDHGRVRDFVAAAKAACADGMGG